MLQNILKSEIQSKRDSLIFLQGKARMENVIYTYEKNKGGVAKDKAFLVFLLDSVISSSSYAQPFFTISSGAR